MDHPTGARLTLRAARFPLRSLSPEPRLPSDEQGEPPGRGGRTWSLESYVAPAVFGVSCGSSGLSSLQLALPRCLVTAIWSRVRDRGVRVDVDPFLLSDSLQIEGELRFSVESTLINVKNTTKPNQGSHCLQPIKKVCVFTRQLGLRERSNLRCGSLPSTLFGTKSFVFLHPPWWG